MKRIIGGLIVGAVVLCAGGAHAQDAPKKEKLTLRAQRAGWIMGMYMGEEKGQPYPFILQVDPQSHASVMGIRAGDELMRFQDQEIRSLPRLFEMTNRLRPGKEVVLWIRRGVQTLRFEVRVPREPGPAPTDANAKESARKTPDGAKEGEADVEGKKKTRKKPPVVIKPIPTEE